MCILLATLLLGACGQSYKEQKIMNRKELARKAREDSAALKIAVMPTLDCLPLYVARQAGLFEQSGQDIRLKYFKAQIDVDTALERGHVEGAVTDLVRAQRIASQGKRIDYPIATNAYWQLITNRNARIHELKQLDDKMLAMTRYSVTDMLGDHAVDSVGLKPERVFRIQINDVSVRLLMMLNNEMDAMLVTEPQATAARMAKNKVLMDSRRLGMNMGVIAFRHKLMEGDSRKRQYEAFIKAYNQACDSINRYGVGHYRELVSRYCMVKPNVADAVPKDLKFPHAAGPLQKDIERADQWLRKK